MIVKVCQFQARREQGERLVEVFQPGEMAKAAAFFARLRGPGDAPVGSITKQADPMLPEVQTYLEKLTPSPNRIYVLVNALGAGEFWGSNINGDYFPESSLIHKGPIYGYETFYSAFPYKHHCFPAGTSILMADRTRKPIEEVQGGEAVMTLDGPRHVIDTMRRHYTGEGIALRLRGEYRELVGTADHPVLIYRRDQVHCRCNYSRLTQSGHEKDCVEYRKSIGDPEYVPMSSVLPGDYLVLPKPPLGEHSVSSEFAKLVGWVAAEGNLGARGLIQFCFSEDNVTDIASVTNCLRENNLHPTVTPRPQDGLVQISASSVEVHWELSQYVTGVLSEKTLTGKVCEWDANSILWLLGTYIDGDGHVPDRGKNAGQLRIRSSSSQMLRILADLIRALGIPATVQWDAHPREMISPTNGKTYISSGSGVVSVNALHSGGVTKHSRKNFVRPIKRKRFETRFGETYLVQVTEVDGVLLDEEVFNLEVDGTHHYVAGEVVVHNCNKDPSRSFGKVEVSAWNDAMKRVELVVMIDRELAARFGAQDVCDRLDKGMFSDVSMGCKVPYDLCSVCLDWSKYREAQSTFDPSRHRSVGLAVLEFHRKNPIRGVSVTRNDYCEHLKNQLNRILGDGRKVYAINDYPRFFDISFVFIGADKTAKVMAKLASAYTRGGPYVVVPSWQVAIDLGYEQPATEKSFEKAASAFFAPLPAKARTEEKVKLSGIEAVRAKLREKNASHAKGAEIIKEVVPSQFGGKAVPTETNRPDIPNAVLDQMGSCPLSEALSTPTTMGMILKPHEFQRITIIHIGKKPLADKLDEEGKVFAPTEETDTSTPLGSGHFSDVLKRLLLPLLEDRSFLEPIATRRAVKIIISKDPTPEDVPRELVKDDPFLQKISAAYNGYLDRFVDCWEGTTDVVNTNPDLWSAVFKRGIGDAFTKEAAGVHLGVILGGAAAGYGLSEYARWQREKARVGTRAPTGPIMNVVAYYPKVMTALGTLAALQQQGSTIPSRILRAIGGFATTE